MFYKKNIVVNPEPKITINEITFSSGQKFTFHPEDKVILVGANNSGKSQTLRELIQLISTDKQRGVVVHAVSLNKVGTPESVEKFIRTKYKSEQDRYYRLNDATFSEKEIPYLWEHDKNRLSALSPVFIKPITANERLTICNPAQSIKRNEQGTKPQHALYSDDQLMLKISGLFERAFGKHLMINYRGGQEILIHVGIRPDINQHPDRVSDAYVDLVEENPLLHEQGDGIKSYTGILFDAVVDNFDITLIDEPEAFLHPPQMRELGKALASEVKGQLFVATHSSEFLKGVLEKTKGKIRILRIQRENDINIINELDSSTVRELWERPILRYSNAFDAIFHEQAVICEDHSDCRLFNFIFDLLASEAEVKLPDTAFIPSGGKDQIYVIAKVLKKAGVPVKAIYDFDLLSDKSKFKQAILAFTDNDDSIHTLLKGWDRINADISQGKTINKSDIEIRDELITLIKSRDEKYPPSLDEINKVIKQNISPWKELKKNGVQGLSRGQISELFDNQLNPLLKKIGIHIILCGEVENFYPTIGGHGPRFVEKLLVAYDEKNVDENKLELLKEFVKGIVV